MQKNSWDDLIQKHTERLHNPDLSNDWLFMPVTLTFLHNFQSPALRIICIFHHPSERAKNNAETGPQNIIIICSKSAGGPFRPLDTEAPVNLCLNVPSYGIASLA